MLTTASQRQTLFSDEQTKPHTEQRKQILLFEKLKPANVRRFCLINELISNQNHCWFIFRGPIVSTLQSPQIEHVWRRRGRLRWTEQEVDLGLTDRLRQRVAHWPQPRSAFQQSDQRFMATLSSPSLELQEHGKKKSHVYEHTAACPNIKSAQGLGRGQIAHNRGRRLDSNVTFSFYKVYLSAPKMSKHTGVMARCCGK